MKVLITIMLVAFCAISTDCRVCKRSEVKQLHLMGTEIKCEEPILQLVPLHVPEGFVSVYPSVYKLNRCTGFLCSGKIKTCQASDVEMKTIKVEWRRNDGSKKCIDVEIEDHRTCKCGCIADQCPVNQELDENTCECDCTKKAEEICNPDDGSKTLTSNCTCLCMDHSKKYNCPDGSMRIEERCSCMKPDEEEIELKATTVNDSDEDEYNEIN